MTKEEQMFRLREDLNLRYEDIGRLVGTAPDEVRKIVARQRRRKKNRKERKDRAEPTIFRPVNYTPERNLEMLRAREEEGLTYRAIGERFGLSVERTRQIVIRQQRIIERRRQTEETRTLIELVRLLNNLNALHEIDLYLQRAAASVRLFERMFPDEKLPVTVVQEREVPR